MKTKEPLSTVLLHRLKRLFLSVLMGYWVVLSLPAFAGGGGENLLLVVNPNDEPSLRIANAYIAARHIPANNVLYLVPPSAGGGGATALVISDTQFNTGYLTPIYNAIAARGLVNQIDYIGTLGQSQVVIASGQSLAMTNCLSQLTQMHNGMPALGLQYRPSELLQSGAFAYPSTTFTYTQGSNAAIHHTQSLLNLSGTPSTPTVQWYMGGMIGYAGQFGIKTEQVIQGLKRSVAADGTKPQGTIYFEDSGDSARVTGSRKPYWAGVQNYMTAHGIPWIQELSGLPVNCQDVMGAQIGVSGFIAPQGSKYLPGSWADNLTSYSGEYYTEAGPNENPSGNLIQSGCAGTGGTVAEPYGFTRYSYQDLFPLCDLFVFQNEGSTLGEAVYKSLDIPSMFLLQGDLLSQPFADIPQVVFTSAPVNGSTVSGIVGLSALASLSYPSIATGIASLSLFVDGTNSGMVVTGSSGTFNLNTTTFTDGVHELRVVAYNNSQAASEGCAILNVAVNNLGESVGIAGTNSYNMTWNQSLPLTVSATQGSGPAITGIQLQSNGRVLGSINGSSGTITLSGTQLAFHANPITPVALLSNGLQVQGPTITVTLQNRLFTGTRPTPKMNQTPGFDYFYYPGAAGNTLATTNFSGTAAYVGHANAASINNTPLASALLDPNVPNGLRGANSAGLAMAIQGSFTVSSPGEYSFWGILTNWTSFGVLVDGVSIRSYDLWNGSSFAFPSLNVSSHPFDTGGTVYLLPGEHTVTFQLVEKILGSSSPSAIFYFSTERPGVPISYIKAGQPYCPGIGVANFAISPTFYTVQKTNGH